MLTVKSTHISFLLIISCFTIRAQSSVSTEPLFNSPTKNLQEAKKLIERNDEENALLYLNACLSKKFNEEEAIFLRARIYSNKNELLKALTDYNSLLDLNTTSKEYYFNRGIIRYKIEQYEMALEDFYSSLKLPNGATQTAFFRSGQGNQGVSSISTLNGMQADVWNNIGLCHQALDQNKKAIYAFNQGIEICPTSPDLHLNKALSYEKCGDLERAKEGYRHVLSMYPDHATAQYNLMNLNANHESNNQLNSLNLFIEENPTLSNGYGSRGLFFFESKDFESALVDFRMAVDLDPTTIDYLFNLAMAYEKLNQFDDAERLFDKVTSMDNNHAGAYFNLGNIQFKRKAYQEAISLFTIAFHIDNTNGSILYNRAIAKYRLGMTEEACKDMEIVNKLDPVLGQTFFKKNCAGN